jgi:hypothetical protein
MRACTVEGCDKPYSAKGYCNAHYNRVIRRGGPVEPISDAERFWSRVDKTDGCWNWTAGKNNMGYGAFCLNGKTEKAHRVSYAWANGNIPEGEWIDHICRNPACVRPSHLRIATPKENRENVDGAPRHNKNSGVRGVSPHRNGRWQARIMHNRKSYSGGLFDTIEEAEAAAIALRLEHFTHNDADRRDS